MDHKVYEHVIEGGPKGLIVHVPGSRVVSLGISFNSGYQFGDLSHYEMPHVLEHLLASGSTTHYPKHSQLMIEIKKNGAYHNAYTSPRANSYVFEFADFELPRIVGLQSEYFGQQLINARDTKTELGNVRQEMIQIQSDYGRYVHFLFNEQAHARYYVAMPDRINQLSGITPKMLEDYYRRSHTWQNLRFYAAGDLADGGRAVVEDLTAALSILPKGERGQPDWGPGVAFLPQVQTQDISQIYYKLGWFAPRLDDRLRAAAVILSSVLGEGFGSRILGDARHRGLAYTLYVDADYAPSSSSLEIGGFVTPDNARPLFELFARHLYDMAAGKVTKAEVEAAKNLRAGSQVRAYQTAGQMLGWYMNRYEQTEEVEDFDGWIKQLYAVTPADVTAVAKYLLDTSAHGSSFIGPVTSALAEEYIDSLGNLWK